MAVSSLDLHIWEKRLIKIKAFGMHELLTCNTDEHHLSSSPLEPVSASHKSDTIWLTVSTCHHACPEWRQISVACLIPM
jgi:predicted transcriptional regulator